MLNRRHKDDCLSLLRKIDKGDIKAFVTTYSIHSIETILDKIGNLEALKIFLKSIGEMKGLQTQTAKSTISLSQRPAVHLKGF